jgi:hypothetical protein
MSNNSRRLVRSQVVAELRKLYTKTGKLPTSREWEKEYTHSAANLARFGGFVALRDEAVASVNTIKAASDAAKDTPELTKLDIPDIDDEEWLDLMAQHKSLRDRACPKRTYVNVLGDPKAKLPMIIIFTGDWHMGSMAFNADKFRKDIAYINSLPDDRVKIYLMGDLIDNVQPRFFNSEAVFGTISPEIQLEVLRRQLDRMKGKLQAACWGNHDVEWHEKGIGWSPVAKLLSEYCHYFFGKGISDFHCGEQVYRIAMNHKWSGTSWFHSVQGQIRGWLDNRADIVVGGHIHTSGYMNDVPSLTPEGDEIHRHLVQVGTYKEADTYSVRNFKPGVIHNEALVVYPDRKKVVRFAEVNDAVDFLGIKPVAKKKKKGKKK